jgi:hypothetical protein
MVRLRAINYHVSQSPAPHLLCRYPSPMASITACRHSSPRAWYTPKPRRGMSAPLARRMVLVSVSGPWGVSLRARGRAYPCLRCSPALLPWASRETEVCTASVLESAPEIGASSWCAAISRDSWCGCASACRCCRRKHESIELDQLDVQMDVTGAEWEHLRWRLFSLVSFASVNVPQ